MMLGVKNSPKAEEKNTETKENLEVRLEEILSKIKGAGNVDVLIVYKNDGKEYFAADTEYTEDSQGNIKNKSEIVMGKDKEVISIQKTIPDVLGVIVTATGAYNNAVKENIKKAVLAALPVLSHRIEVLVSE